MPVKLFLGIVVKTRLEVGCEQFELHDVISDGSLYLYEEWQNEECQNETELDEHYSKDYTKAVFEKYQNWLAEPVEVVKLVKA